MRNVSDKFIENIKIHVVFSDFFPENRAVYEIVFINRPQVTIWHMRSVFWIRNATNTHSEYVTLIAFPLPQWLHERDSMLRYT